MLDKEKNEGTSHPVASKPPRKRDRKATEASFVAAAAKVFGQRGFDAATTKAIAQEAGFSEALINAYFGGKEGIFRAVLRNDGRGTDEQVAFFGRPIRDDLATEICETFAFMTANIRTRSDNMRMVIARVLVDPDFQIDFGKNTVRLGILNSLGERLEDYQARRLMRADVTPHAAAEYLVGLCFQLGFLNERIFSVSRGDHDLFLREFSLLSIQALMPLAA